MTIRGDFGKLRDFRDRLRKHPEVLERVSKVLAEETVALVRQGFNEERDPYGRAWRPLVLRQGRILQDTGGLRNSWHRAVHKRGFRVWSGKSYAVYHQRGTGIYGRSRKRIKPIRAKALRLGNHGFASSVKGTPQRRMVPVAGRIPRNWSVVYRRTANIILKKAFTR